MVEHITTQNFDEKVANADGAVVVDFYADWCGPCRVLGPVFEEVSGEVDSAAFFKVNVDEAGDIAAQFGVRSIPTVIVFKDGKEVDRVMGAMPKDDLKKMVSQHV